MLRYQRMRRPTLKGLIGLVTILLMLLYVWAWGTGASTDSADPASYKLTGRVIEVTDGDTLVVRSMPASDGHRADSQRIRLASIDAPERHAGRDKPGQPYADAARAFLRDRVQDKTLTLICFEQDRHERHICDVTDPSGQQATINQLLVLHGLAWANMEGRGKFLRDSSLPELQTQARSDRRGLWAQPEPVPPWVWRFQCWRNGQCG